MKARSGLDRWMTFNAVGILGVVVQLSMLAVLTRLAHAPVCVSTMVAVELALLHNFGWHVHWTWKDRRTASRAMMAERLVRFHLLNGGISMIGNLVIMSVFAGRLGMDPLIANGVAILACSIVNFFASDGMVFAASSRNGRTASGVLAVALAVLAGGSSTRVSAAELFAELKPATIAAWQSYERRVDDRYSRGGGDHFFAEDQFRGGGSWRQTAISGGVPMTRLDAAVPGATETPVPDGRIHHWVGAVFVPGATVDSVLDYLLTHAGKESGSYEDVLASKLLDRNGDRVRVFLKLRRTSIITVTYNTEHTVEYRRLGSSRAASRSVATKIAELTEAGTPREQEKPAGSDRGFLWRLNAYWRYEQTDGGVLIECESVSLSRSVPTLLRPFVTGTVERIARESLERTLVGLRTALTNQKRSDLIRPGGFAPPAPHLHPSAQNTRAGDPGRRRSRGPFAPLRSAGRSCSAPSPSCGS
jgi:putative flippase GtrA